FAGACQRAVNDAYSFERKAQQIEAAWRGQLGRVRAQSATDLLLRSLIGAPVITVSSAAGRIGRSLPQTNEAVQPLVENNILRQVNEVNVGKRNRAFEAPTVIDGFHQPGAATGKPRWRHSAQRPFPSRPASPLRACWQRGS
ncbi:MAG: hypothetical protein ACRDNZ_21640, partial [Streptosporangiaceae bacterium]